MAKKIKNSDLFDANLFVDPKQNALELAKALELVEKGLIDIAKTAEKAVKKADFKSMKGIKDFEKNLESVDIATKEYNATQEKRLKIQAQISVEQSRNAKKTAVEAEKLKLLKKANVEAAKAKLGLRKETVLEAEARKLSEKAARDEARAKLGVRKETALEKEQKIQARKATKRLAQEELGLISVYQKESERLNDLRKKFKDMILTQSGSRKETKRLQKEIQQLDTKLKKVDGSVGQFQRSVGNYGKALNGLKSRFISLGNAAKLAGGFLLFRGLKGAFKTIKDFEKANADLAGVLGTTRSNIKALTKDAKALGATTIFKASEVTGLQKEFAKLGFAEKEILKVTKATLTLAVATSTELPRSAEVVGNTLRAFQLDSTETGRLVDVMAKSFNSSALDMSKFSTAMAAVAPVAKNANVGLEETTALLGTIVNNGIDASTAGTALRNIFLELAKSGMSFEDAMKQINTSTNKNATALQLFGKRGATVATVLAENTKQTKALENELDNAGGTAEDVAKEQMNTLSGSVSKLSSAWEGFVLSLEDGDGVIAKVVNGAIDLVSGLLNQLTKLGQTWEEQVNTGIIAGAEESARNIQGIADGVRLAQQQTETELKASIRRINAELKKARLEEDTARQESLEGQLEGIKSVEALRKNASAESLSDSEKRLAVLIELEKREQSAAFKADNIRDLDNLEIEKLAESRDGLSSSINSLLLGGVDISSEEGLSAIVEANSADFEKFSARQRKAEELLTASIKDQTDARLENLSANNRELAGVLAREELERRRNQQNATSGGSGLSDKELKEQARIADLNRKRISDERKKQIADDISAAEKKSKLINDIEQAQFDRSADIAGSSIDDIIAQQVELAEGLNDVQTELIDDQINKEFELRKNALIDQADFEKNELKRTVVERTKIEKGRIVGTGVFDIEIEEKTAEEKELINEKLKSDILKLEQDKNKQIIDGNQEVIDAQIKAGEELQKKKEEEAKEEEERKKEEAEAEKKAQEQRKKNLEEIAGLLAEQAIERSKLREKQIDEEISSSQRREDQLRKDARETRLDADESIAAQEAKQADLARKRLEEQRRQRRVEQALAAFNLLSQKIQTGDDKPVANTIKDILSLSQLVRSIPAFADGTEFVERNNGEKKGTDTVLSWLDEGERVVDKQTNKALAGVSNDELAGIVREHKSVGLGKDAFSHQRVVFSSGPENNSVISEIQNMKDSVVKAIEDKPVVNYKVDEVTREIVRQEETRNRVVREHMDNKMRF